MSKTLEELKTEATELGIKFTGSATVASLESKIEAFYKASENESTPDVKDDEVVEDDKTALAAQKMTNERNFKTFVQAQRRAAEKTRVVTIIDNDSRVNNITTTCTVSASNEYFDLGTVILPLNERVEVREGHLNVLRELRIPQHTKNPNDPKISIMVMRPRYTIQYEDK